MRNSQIAMMLTEADKRIGEHNKLYYTGRGMNKNKEKCYNLLFHKHKFKKRFVYRFVCMCAYMDMCVNCAEDRCVHLYLNMYICVCVRTLYVSRCKSGARECTCR